MRDQFIAKLQRKRHHLGETAARDFETCAGMDPAAFIRTCAACPWPRSAPGSRPIRAWVRSSTARARARSRPSSSPATRTSCAVPSTATARPSARRTTCGPSPTSSRPRQRDPGPAHRAHPPAGPHPPTTARTRPGPGHGRIQRGQPRHRLARATNQEIAARIVGYIRQAAIGDPLVPYDQRVDGALVRILASRPWTKPPTPMAPAHRRPDQGQPHR